MDHDPTAEMGHESFAAKLAQMNLKESDKCTCGNKQQSIFGNHAQTVN